MHLATSAFLAALMGLTAAATTMYIDPDAWQYKSSSTSSQDACVTNLGANLNVEACQAAGNIQNNQRWMTGYINVNPNNINSQTKGYVVSFSTTNTHVCMTAPNPATVTESFGLAIQLSTCSGDNPGALNDAERQLWDLTSGILVNNQVPTLTIELDGAKYCADLCTQAAGQLCLYKSTGTTGIRPCERQRGIFTAQQQTVVGPTSTSLSITLTFSATTTSTSTATAGTSTFTSDLSTTVSTTTATVGVFTTTVSENLDPSVVTTTQNMVTTTLVVVTTTITISDGGFPSIPVFPTQPTDVFPPFTTSSNPVFPPFGETTTQFTTQATPEFSFPPFTGRDFQITEAPVATEIVYVIPQPATTLTTTLTVGGFYNTQVPDPALFTTLAPAAEQVQRREVAAGNIKNPIDLFVYVPRDQQFSYSIQSGEYSKQWWSQNWIAVGMVGSALVGTVVASTMLTLRVMAEKKRQRMMEAQAIAQSEGR